MVSIKEINDFHPTIDDVDDDDCRWLCFKEEEHMVGVEGLGWGVDNNDSDDNREKERDNLTNINNKFQLIESVH